MFNNFTIVNENFPLDNETNSGCGYTQAERNSVYEYIDDIATAGEAAHLP